MRRKWISSETNSRYASAEAAKRAAQKRRCRPITWTYLAHDRDGWPTWRGKTESDADDPVVIRQER